MKTEDLLKLITEDVVIEIMDENGSPLYGRGSTSDGQPFLMFKTICHGGDSEGKLYYYSNSQTFYCWTNCGSMTFFTCIKKILNIPDSQFYRVVSYVANKLGISDTSDRYGFDNSASVKQMHTIINNTDRLCELKNNQSIDKLVNINKFYDDKILNMFDHNSYYEGWLEEGITVETMQKYEISYYWPEKHIIIPHRDMDGNLIGIRRRSLKPEDSKNKYMPETICDITYGHALSLNLYGLQFNKDYIAKTRTAVLVEGEKSVMKADSYFNGKSNVVATCGFNVSDWQIRALVNLGVNTVYLGFDKDFDITKEREYEKDSILWNDYLRYRDRIDTLAARLKKEFETYIIFDRKELLGPKDSPLDKNRAVFEQLKLSAKPFIQKEKGYKIKLL